MHQESIKQSSCSLLLNLLHSSLYQSTGSADIPQTQLCGSIVTSAPISLAEVDLKQQSLNEDRWEKDKSLMAVFIGMCFKSRTR